MSANGRCGPEREQNRHESASGEGARESRDSSLPEKYSTFTAVPALRIPPILKLRRDAASLLSETFTREERCRKLAAMALLRGGAPKAGIWA
jgi:hypothetical protein